MPVSPDQFRGLPPELAAEQLSDRVGIEIVSWDPDRVVGTMPVAGNRQPAGLLHGGASAVLAETLGSVAAALRSMPERFPVGLVLACAHHRGVSDGLITGVASPLHVGRTVSTFEITITDQDGHRTCSAHLTCMLPDAAKLPAMATSESQRQVRQLRHDVDDVYEIVSGHTVELGEIRSTLAEHGATLAEHGAKLDELTGSVADLRGSVAEILSLLRPGGEPS